MQNTTNMFAACFNLHSVLTMDMSRVTTNNTMFSNCFGLTEIRLKNNKTSISLGHSSVLSKDSLLYLINNEAATSAITVTLHSYAYTRLSEDADIVAALANHPNISLASA